ncbi:RBBP9/YdeN family alpha/beta hydrolase [Xanthobacter autotrophicus]|jgi:predicted alpha/beta hydrolase family esterase|uniref:Serine hydrolase family protein n=1 Tax=Xanthobacter autotrophicus TaxID=280 RepID=A0A6C1KAQ4_XANAU|nr:alpha/beta hydrolase [Xanthobacter autotrophicus]TLX41220.1 serine hydrolase family protein [Xanthobacter autotrophicus]
MRSTDAALLIVPGWQGSGPDHWQSRWERSLSTARRVQQADWDRPDREDWPRRLVAAVVAADKPVVVVAHSLGVPTLLHAAPLLPEGKVKGAFLVAPPDLDVPELDPMVANFGPMPTAPLPFPSVLVASRTDPYCSYARAEGFALDWGAAIVDAGDAGHINADAGYGPWPEGSMRLLGLLQSLK